MSPNSRREAQILLTVKQVWVLSTIALAGQITKHRIERVWDKATTPTSSFNTYRITDWDSFNMRVVLESLEKKGLIRKEGSHYSVVNYPYYSKRPHRLLKPFTVKVGSNGT